MLELYLYSHNEKYNYFTEEDLKIRNILSNRLFINKVTWSILLLAYCIFLLNVIRPMCREGGAIVYDYQVLIDKLGNWTVNIVVLSTLISMVSRSIRSYILWQKIDNEHFILIYKKYLIKKWIGVIVDISFIFSLTIYCSEGLLSDNKYLFFIPIVLKIVIILSSLLLSQIRLWMIQSTLGGAIEGLEEGEYKNAEDILKETFGDKKDTEVVWGTSYTYLIFEMNNLLKKIEKVAEEEKQTSQNKAYLITNLSHDLKTPLTSIINSVYILKNDNLTNIEREEQIEILEKKILRLKNLINDLSDMIDSEQTSVVLNKEEIIINEVLLNIGDTFRERLKNLNLDVKYNIPQENVILFLDKEKMIRVFENIFSNIEKYSLEDTRVYIDMKIDEESIQINFKNISKYEIEVDNKIIGNRFVKGDKSRHIEGHGLGLSIVKNLVKVQGGNVDINIEGDLFKLSLIFNKQ